MTNEHSFLALVEQSIKANWHSNALTDYKQSTLQYHDVARKIEKMHIMFRYAGIKKGDKVAICGRNSSLWACSFMAVLTYGAVVVPIQNIFTSDQILHIVNHSDSRILYADSSVLKQIPFQQMSKVLATVRLDDLGLDNSRNPDLYDARQRLNDIFSQAYPTRFRPEHVNYHKDQPHELALINYTSGTTGFSKGVMLSYESLWSNLDFLSEIFGKHLPNNAIVLAFLPMAHMYGLTVDFLLHFCLGNHLHFLMRPPSPTIIQEAFQDLRPHFIISVPLVLEKIVRTNLLPIVKQTQKQALLRTPAMNKLVKQRLRDRMMELVGGRAYEIIIGGASLSHEVEELLKNIDFPFSVAYGTTETGPMISTSDYTDFIPTSCGTPAKHMEVKIASPDPARIPGELLTRGLNVMTGYYKDEKATSEAIDAEGWLHTGDLACMDDTQHIYIMGRIKNMLLGSNGQNVYPEEIEDKLNSLIMVKESLILQKGQQFIALVNPDTQQAEALGVQNNLDELMAQNLRELNAHLPKFCQISRIQLHTKDFERTSKGSIKRYLYVDCI